MSVGILGSIFYVNSLLNGKDKTSVTQVKKTKASAQTYHKLLAINLLSVTPINMNNSGESGKLGGEGSKPESTISPTMVIMSPFPTLTAVPSPSPTLTVPTSEPTLTPTQSLLLAYHNPSPTLIPITNTQTAVATVTDKPSHMPTKTQHLPETGWVQTSSLLFIIAASTILLSLLF